jgi:hypothetical protein
VGHKPTHSSDAYKSYALVYHFDMVTGLPVLTS